GEVSGDAARGAGAGSREKYEKVMEEKSTEDDTETHMKNFLDSIRARDYKKLNADIEIGARSAAFCHLANIAYRVGRTLNMGQDGHFANDPEADALLTRDYRAPYVVPEDV
ncbi:MAG: Gfo/Idh/MocA family protein, partial [Bryobacteraceae bacterium]